jgi:hypothetical protein
MRNLLLALPLLLGQLPAAQAQVSVGIGIELPGVSIGINLPIFPDLQPVPGYPVYYAPQAPGNYFYFDGLYWVFQGDDWYAASWYNGPWRRVMPDLVPVYLLLVPVRYYRQPPVYFRAWRPEAAPHWDEHWGREWQQRRPDWQHGDRRAAPPPAPLPTYQRRYPQSRYPQEPEQQRAIRAEHFNYQPREPVARQAYQLPDRPPSRQPPPAQARPQPRTPPPQPLNRQHPPPAAQPPAPPHDRPQAAPQDRGRPQSRPDAPGRGQERRGDAPGQQGNERKGGRGGD